MIKENAEIVRVKDFVATYQEEDELICMSYRASSYDIYCDFYLRMSKVGYDCTSTLNVQL